MTLLLAILLFLCVLGVFHTYLFYPRWVVNRATSFGGGDPNVSQVQSEWAPTPDVRWPPVTVLMAAHNEEAVLEQKLQTLAAQDYPGELRFLVGSDNSSDRTNDILAAFAAADERLVYKVFTTRQGKPGIINQLATRAGMEGVYLLTDASVMLAPNTVTELVKPMLAEPGIGLVDTTMVQTGGTAAGVGGAETNYIDGEVAVKRAEGQLWRTMIGPFGGCFALRARAFRPVPDNFLVDDFFLCMSAYEQGYGGVSQPAAVVEETVGQELQDEFRRKVRISSGNWQNLVRFRHLWWPPNRNDLSFALFSHKILRWWTPFLLLVGALAWWGLAWSTGNHIVLLSVAVVSVLFTGGALLDALLAAFGINLPALRALRYFIAMNAALLVGFYRFLTGIRSNVWQPSSRN